MSDHSPTQVARRLAQSIAKARKELAPVPVARPDAGNPEWKREDGLQSRWINLDAKGAQPDVTMNGATVTTMGIEMLFSPHIPASDVSAISAFIIDAIEQVYRRDVSEQTRPEPKYVHLVCKNTLRPGTGQ